MKISEKQKQNIEQIAKKYQIRDIYIFGSEISGFKHEGSDLDVGVVFESGLPENALKTYGNIGVDLSAILSKHQLDLVFLEEAPLHFQFKALTEGQLIYSADYKKALDFQEKIINYYRDYKFFIDEYFKGTLERLNYERELSHR